MAEVPKASEAHVGSGPTPIPKASGNPALRMMGLPRLRAKLPSRNWTIFLAIVGSFSGAVVYDRRERSKAQQKWCNAVTHLSQETLPTDSLPPKFTVYLAAPPGDSLRAAREHFQEYVKPMLVAAAVDWDVVEGRKEGDLRAKVAERARRERRKHGEQSTAPSEEDLLDEIRQNASIKEEGPGGEIIVGRHTWKEYIRGIHEGYLGPADVLPELVEETPAPVASPLDQASGNDKPPLNSEMEGPADEASPSSSSDTGPDKKEEPKTKPPPSPTPPYILPDAYKNASISPYTPSEFAPSTVLPLPHILGFLNTPIRIYRFLNRRHLAEETGRAVSSLLLSLPPSISYTAPADSNDISVVSYHGDSEKPSWEQQRLLLAEELDWHKIAHKPNPDEEPNKERPWTEPMVIDFRIGSRMRKCELVAEPAPTSNTGKVDILRSEGTMLAHGNSTEWKGGAARPERTGWGVWLMESLGFENHVPKCEGWKDGEANLESE